ncbi:MAG: glycosyltransferase family 39 protein [Proteobacteria bacterium]|nr:glycosyltransferase family 39 protein [Pseudomonadota bacterium]
MTAAARSKAFDRTTLAFVAVLIAATTLRIWALQAAPLNLDHNEAAFWAWSRTPAWGYLNAPPMLTWAIWASTHAFGAADWTVRLAAPLAQAATALALYTLGRNIYGAKSGFWTGAVWLLTPGVWYSSTVISADVLLLPFVSLALLATWRMVQTRAMAWAIVLGVSVGLGFNAAYAVLYFPLGLLLAARRSQPVCEALKGGRGLAALAIALALAAPNIIWNAQHSFESAQQAATNLNINFTNLFNLSRIVEFMTGQALLVGPIVFFVLLGLFARAVGRAGGQSDEDRFLLAFTLPPLMLVTAFAIIARADPSWPITGYPAALTWLVGSLIGTASGKRLLAAALVSNVVLGGYIAFGFFHPSSAGVIGSARESAAWRETAHAIALRATPLRGERPFNAVVIDNRDAFYQLNFYWTRERAVSPDLPPLRLWMLQGPTQTAPEGADPLHAGDGARVLVAHTTPNLLPFVAGDFTTFRAVDHLQVPLGGGAVRTIDLSIGEGYAPAHRDGAFMERLQPHSQSN